MKFSFTDEQREFREILRRFLEDKSPTGEVRRLMETAQGYDQGVWEQLSQELGLTAVHIPEEYGGQGFGIGELAIAVEEMGRALLCAPYFASTVMAATAVLKAANDHQKRELLPAIASGETIATFAIAEDSGHWNPDGIATQATRSGGNYLLNGVKSFVVDGQNADSLIVAARSKGSIGDGGLSIFRVDPAARGITRSALTTLDPTRKLARITFSDAEAELLGDEGAAAGAIRDTIDIACIALANEMVGGAEKLRETALDYANMRVQFGRPIASFQALKHKAADILLEAELAKSAAYYAAAAVDEGDDDISSLASLTKAAAAEAYMQTAVHTVQIHGGIGFTWDNDTQLWFKRAKSSEVFLGTADYHRERMLQHMGI